MCSIGSRVKQKHLAAGLGISGYDVARAGLGTTDDIAERTARDGDSNEIAEGFSPSHVGADQVAQNEGVLTGESDAGARESGDEIASADAGSADDIR